MSAQRRAHQAGGGIGSLAAAAFMIRDGGLQGSQMAVYELLGIDREVPPIMRNDKLLKVNLNAVVKAFK